MLDGKLNQLIAENNWLTTPIRIMTREGKEVSSSSDAWQLPYAIYDNTKINFKKIENEALRWVTKRYIQERLETTSTHAGYTAFSALSTELFKFQHDFGLAANLGFLEIKENLIQLFEHMISKARANHRLWAIYRPVQWYLWCVENYPELGFCSAYGLELDAMVIPGNPKGEAIRTEELEQGPLHRSLELPLLINAMKQDESTKLEHLQQKAALALSIAFGRNSANLTYLRETDLQNITPEAEEACYILKMPRIKKRQLNPRDDLLEEYLEPQFVVYIQQLIEANRTIRAVVNTSKGRREIEKPLFIKVDGNQGAISAGLIEESYNMTSKDISDLLRNFVKRHNIISPITKSLLRLSTRRLRYTLATGLAAEGISKRELARILDHTDTQHVQVYYEMAGSIVEHLDKAVAKGFAKYLNLFKGKVIDNPYEAINGERDDKHLIFVNEIKPKEQTEIGVCGEASICHLDPPFSCYLCPKFQPYKHADHEHVLECLLESRAARIEKYENARLGIQLDQVVVAVAQVAELCKEVEHHG